MITIPTFPSWARATAIKNFTRYSTKFHSNWTFLLLHTGFTESFDIKYTLIAFCENTTWRYVACIFEFSSSVQSLYDSWFRNFTNLSMLLNLFYCELRWHFPPQYFHINCCIHIASCVGSRHFNNFHIPPRFHIYWKIIS